MKNKKTVIRIISGILLLSLVAGICLMGAGCSKDDTTDGTKYTVKLDQTSCTMVEDQKMKLTATVMPEGAVTWSTSDNTVVSVSNGELLAKKVGTATVTATVGETSASCQVTVTAGTNSFRYLEPDTVLVVEKGGAGVEVRFSLYTVNPDGTKTKDDNAEITYEIENTKIAEIKDGKILGRMGGVTKVIATCGDVTASAEVKVYDKFISTAAQWCEMLTSRTLGEFYLLVSDIDFAGQPYSGAYKGAPGSVQRNSFRATLDGNGHTVKNIRLEGTETEYVSIFGQLYGAKIRNIHFENVTVAARNASGLATSISNDASVVENISMDIRFETVPTIGCALFNTAFGGDVNNIVIEMKTPSQNAKNDRVSAIQTVYGLNTSGIYVLTQGAIDGCEGVYTYTSKMEMAWDINSQKLLPDSSWTYIGGAELPALIHK